MILYHGTNFSAAMNIVNNGIDLSCSQPFLDFGPGFYATPDYYHAAVTAIRKTDKYNRIYKVNERPYIVKIDFQMSDDVNLVSYDGDDVKWGEFVLNNRLSKELLDTYSIIEHNQDLKYDICYGGIADGKIIRIARSVNLKECTPYDIKFTDFLKNNKQELKKQYSFHTEKSLACIKILSGETIKNENKYRDRIIERRAKYDKRRY